MAGIVASPPSPPRFHPLEKRRGGVLLPFVDKGGPSFKTSFFERGQNSQRGGKKRVLSPPPPVVVSGLLKQDMWMGGG